jgi:hypothetical protein
VSWVRSDDRGSNLTLIAAQQAGRLAPRCVADCLHGHAYRRQSASAAIVDTQRLVRSGADDADSKARIAPKPNRKWPPAEDDTC